MHFYWPWPWCMAPVDLVGDKKDKQLTGCTRGDPRVQTACQPGRLNVKERVDEGKNTSWDGSCQRRSARGAARPPATSAAASELDDGPWCCSRPLRRRGALRWASGLAGEPSASRSTGAGSTSCRRAVRSATATTCTLVSERLGGTVPAWSGSAGTSRGLRWVGSVSKNSPMAPSSYG